MITKLSADQIKRFGIWKQANEFLTSLNGRCVFRGVSNAEWDLKTSLDLCARYHHGEAEKLLIESFEHSLQKVTTSLPPVADRVSWMALMRHYGLPSRLLDCTESVSVAAYFAVEKRPKSDFAIWAFDIGAVQRSAEVSLGILNATNAPLSPLELGTDPIFMAAFRNTKRFIALVDVKHKTERQQKQRALFLCPGSSESPFWRNLMDVPSARASGALYQVVLPSSAHDQVMADLDGENINHEELLPGPGDLDALCTELRTALEDSQSKYGHLEWRVKVLPEIELRGLRATIVDK
jgi:hypothetical protein